MPALVFLMRTSPGAGTGILMSSHLVWPLTSRNTAALMVAGSDGAILLQALQLQEVEQNPLLPRRSGTC